MTDKDKIPLYIKKQLADDIETLGGIGNIFQRGKTKHSLSELLDHREDIYGVRGSDVRLKIRNLVVYWGRLPYTEYSNKVLFKFKIQSYKERHPAASQVTEPKQERPPQQETPQRERTQQERPQQERPPQERPQQERPQRERPQPVSERFYCLIFA
jgi:hypothetical protein